MHVDGYSCDACGHDYPVVLGIPDFRVFPDPWISIEADREKGIRLEQATLGEPLDVMVREYWRMTPSTPPAQVERFIQHVLSGESRASQWLVSDTAFVSAPDGAHVPCLEIGSATGDMVVAGRRLGIMIIGSDIAFRWLVVARRRAQLAGVACRLICCNAEHLPFRRATFGTHLSMGTLEHCRSAEAVIREAARVLRPRGRFRARTVNRYSLLREPHVRVWGVGFVPRKWADRYVRLLTGERYLHHRALSAGELREAMRAAHFERVRLEGAHVLDAERDQLRGLAALLPLYDWSRRARLTRASVARVSPLIEACGDAA